MNGSSSSISNAPVWQLAHGRSLCLARARVMAILNVTPDSFSDGGNLTDAQAARDAAIAAVYAGADMLDIGGESTRPGAPRVPANEQISRVVPAIAAIRAAGVAVPISVDTTRAAVAKEAIAAGADAINDVSAGEEDDAMLPFAAEAGVGVALMHRRCLPAEDQYSTAYRVEPNYGTEGVVAAVGSYLHERAQAAINAGVSREAIVLDPGLGFGKSVEQNLDLLRGLDELEAIGFPLLVGASRKSFVGKLVGEENPMQRGPGSVALAIAARLQSSAAAMFRVHDVAMHAQAFRAIDGLFP